MKRRLLIATAALGIAVLMSSGAWAAGMFQIDWWSIDGGAGTSTGGSYTLRGTIGQADAGVVAGGSYELSGGFHAGDLPMYQVLLPLTQK